MGSLHRLSVKKVNSVPSGKYADGGGLWFQRRDDGGAQWFLRVTVHGRRREMGLGRYPDVSLKEAREAAVKWRGLVRQGLDPIKERERERRRAARNLHVLSEIAVDALESRKSELKNDGRAGRWLSPLEHHVLPKLGKVPVADIDQNDIRDVLSPIWHTKADTARKALNRLSICLRHAAAIGLDVDLQATEKAKALLGKTRHKPKNIPAMAWQKVPAFYQSLSGGSVTELALKLLILTAVRSNPLRHMHLDQVAGDVWTIPAEFMKGRKDATVDFRVPLSNEALSVIEEASLHERDGFLFPGSRKGVISDMTMSKFMERRELEARPHGFRSSFRDWAAENASASYEVAEASLGHVTGSSVERAYRRTDYLDQRRDLLTAWSAFLTDQKRRENDP